MRRKFSRVSGSLMNLTPNFAASSLPALLRGDDGDALGCDADMPQDQRQHALADAAEADEQDPARKLDVDLV